MAYVLGANAFRQLRADLKEIDRQAPKQLARINKEVAQYVVQVARGKANELGGVFRKAAPALSASGSGSAVAVFLKKTSRPYAFGAEFGSKKYKQFDPWRGNPKVNAFDGGPGYFLYPSIRDHRARIEEKWTDAVEALLKIFKPVYEG
ncbi:hypothetical protein [Amycolatopsis sp. lyj-112]|uniref:hypothetical protein n=1 Tax=Amycolatopsis sp. lyj-112 TaxID=2789288 RepID=UPI003977F980